ncbi:MAG: RecQ family zinc-binding domain-containing protein, partial [Flavobacteriales bacterium]
VVHMDLPDSLEAYFQEAGRAGRDGKQSWAVLLFSPADKKTVERNFENSFPSIDEIRTVYQALANHLQIATGAGLGCSYDFDIDTFCASYKLKPLLVFHCMKFLEKEGYITTTDALHLPSRIHFIADRNALYRFQLQNEDADRLVKTMLRSYPGMFEDYVSVREGMISKRSGMPVADLKRLLKLMSEHKILSYIPQNEHPQIIFNVGRMPARDINIKQENLSDLKQRTWQRIEAMLHYAETRKTCRSRILLSYFGEIQEHNCGKCDVCIEEKNKFVKSGEYAKLSTVIKELLAVRNLTLSELIIRTKNKEEKALSVIRWMVDNGEIHYTDKDKLSLSI